MYILEFFLRKNRFNFNNSLLSVRMVFILENWYLRSVKRKMQRQTKINAQLVITENVGYVYTVKCSNNIICRWSKSKKGTLLEKREKSSSERRF